MNHGHYGMSGRQPRREKLFLRSFWSQTLILSLFFITCWFRGEAYGAAGDILGYYIHSASGQQKVYSAAFDSDGSKVIVGYTQASAGSKKDFYVMKLSANSTGQAWAAPLTFDLAGDDDIAAAVAIDTDDNVVVAGSAHNGTNFDVHTIKYNASGQVIWQNTYNGPNNGHDTPTAMVIDDSNNIYIGGYTRGASGASDFLILKYDSTGPIGGKPTWAAIIDSGSGNADEISALAVRSVGTSRYVAATGIAHNGTNNDIMTVKFDANGNGSSPIWKVIKSGVTSDDWGKAVQLDSGGNVVMAGFVNNGINADIYLVKYVGNTASPPLDWTAVTYNGGSGDEPRALAIDSADNIYVTGFTYSTSSGFNNYFTAKYYGTGASKGTLAWPAVKTYNSGGDNMDTALAIAVNDDSVYVTGSAGASANLNIVTIKYRKDNGTEIWVSPFTTGTAGYNDSPVGIGIAADGKIHVAGTTAIDATFNTDFVGLRLDPGALNSPTGLIASLVSQTEIRLDWTLNSTTETGVEIYRRTATTEYTETPTYTLNGTGITFYNDTGRTAHTKYYYKIRVFGTNGAFSLFSNEVSLQTTVINYVAPTWTYKYRAAGAGASHDKANAVAVGSDHHPVATGYSNTSLGSLDYYTVKINYSSKAVLWTATADESPAGGAPDAGQCVVVDSNNNPVVSGYSTRYNAPRDTKDFYTIKYNGANGSKENPPGWEKAANGYDNGDDETIGIVSTKDGLNNIVVVGYGKNGSANNDIFVVKYNGADGLPLWSSPAVKVYDGGGEDIPAAVALDSNGDIIVTGKTYNGSNFDVFTRKYSGIDGSTVWTVIKNGWFGDDEGFDVAVGSDNSVYVTGYLRKAAAGKRDIYTVKYKSAYDAVDQKVWERTYDGTADRDRWGSAVKVDTNGDDNNIVIAGTMEQSTAGKYDFVVIKYDSAGTVLWTRILDRPSDNDIAKAMAMDVSGNICIAGESNTNVADIITVKYGYDGEVIGTTLYDGAAHNEDRVKGMAVSKLGHAYVAGSSMNELGDFDFLLLQCEGSRLQAPAPFAYTANYFSIDFSWADNNLNADADGFRLRRQAGSCAAANPNSWTTYTFPKTTTNYSDLNLAKGVTYCYQIQAYKTSGTESRWLEKTIATIYPPAPGNFTATATDTTTVRLTWTDNLAGEDRFELKRCTGSGTACDEDAEFTVSLPDQNPGIVQYDDVSACSNTTYTYRIQGRKVNAFPYWDSYIGYATVTTPAAATPSSLVATKQSEGRIDLTWTDTNTDQTGFKIYRCDATDVPGCTPALLAAEVWTSNVIFLAMDETSWTGAANEVKDTSTTNNHATAFNAVTTIAGGHTSRAGSFNGSNQYISWAYTRGTPTNNFTIAAWVKATITDGIDTQSQTGTAGQIGQHYLFYPDDKGTDGGAGISVGTTSISVYENGTNYTAPLAVCSTGSCASLGTGWNHIAVTYTDRQPKIYLNGVLVLTGSVSLKNNVYAPTRVGGGTFGYFAGTVDEVVVYDRSLTDTEVKALANMNNVLFLNMDETSWTGTAGEVKDASAAINNATAYGGVNTTGLGHTDRAGSFDGGDDYLSWTYGGGTPTNNFTIAAWVKATTTHGIDTQSQSGTDGQIGQKYLFYPDNKLTDCGAGVSVGTNGISVYENGTGFTAPLAVCSTGSCASLGTGWNHIVVTFTNKQPKIYLNGALVWTGVASLKSNIYAPTKVGGDLGGFGFFAGKVDEVAVYNRTFTDAEVTAAYKFKNQIDNIQDKFVDMPLQANTTYKYQVAAFKTAASSCGGGWTSTATGTQTALTDPVTDVNHVPVLNSATPDATEITSKINLSWTDKTTTEEMFVIERCLGNGCTNFSPPDATYTVPANTTTYSDVAACRNTFNYRIKAKRTTPAGMEWESGPSTPLKQATTTSTINVPAALTWDTANSHEEQVKLTWTDSNTDEDGIEIWRCTGNGCNSGFGLVATVGRGILTYTDTQLAPNTYYGYQIRAVKNTGCSWQTGFTATVSANTNILDMGLSATPLNTTQIDLNWTDRTGSESGFVLERCAGTCNSGGNFSTVYGIGVGVTNYIDTINVCNGQTYSYRLKAIDQEFPYGYNGCWTKRALINSITNFQANSIVEFTVNYDATAMQADYDDLRFYQFTDGTLTNGQVLPHYIFKYDNTKAWVWLKTGANASNIYMYYGNANAVKVPNGGGIDFAFFDDFRGTTYDSNKWQSGPPYPTLFQNDGLQFVENGTTDRAFIAKTSFNRDEDRTMIYRYTIKDSGSNYWFPSFGPNNSSSYFYDSVHSIYYSGVSPNTIYENYTSASSAYKQHTVNAYYEGKITASKNGGAKYYVRGGSGSFVYATWNLLSDTTAKVPLTTITPMWPRFINYSSGADVTVDMVSVMNKDLVEVTVGLDAAQNVSCPNDMPHDWASSYSGIVTATASTATLPTITGAGLSESQISLAWPTLPVDTTGVKLQRCLGNLAACTASQAFVEIPITSDPPNVVPVVRFEMDEASWGNGVANDIKDGVGGKNHGTAYNSATTIAGGHTGRAGSFDGVSKYATWSYAGGIPTNNFTISAWVKPNATHEVDTESTTGIAGFTGQKYLFGATKMDWYSGGVGVSVGTNGISVYERSDTYMPPRAVYSGSLNPDTNGWSHITVTYTNRVPKIYLNGALVSTGSTSPKATVYAPTRVGGIADSEVTTGYFNGSVDEVAIYNQSLSDAEVQYLYKLGSKTFIDTGLATSTWYTYKLAMHKSALDATCTWGESGSYTNNIGYSALYAFSTTTPPAPVITSAAPTSTTDIKLDWTDLTGSNTAFQVQRCLWNGSSCSAYATVATTQGNATTFTDSTVCKGSQYKYQLIAADDVFSPTPALSNPGTAGWSRRRPLTITNFAADHQIKVVIPYDPDMKPDFSDIRFRDDTANQELSYWLESKTDGVTATVWFRTKVGQSSGNTVNLYYGNYAATSSSNGTATFILFDDFTDNVIDATKWTLTVPGTALPSAETGGVMRFGTAASTGSGSSVIKSNGSTPITPAKPYVVEYTLQQTAYTGNLPYLQEPSPSAFYQLKQEGNGWRWYLKNNSNSLQAVAYSPYFGLNSGPVRVKLIRDTNSVSIYENDVLVNNYATTANASGNGGIEVYVPSATTVTIDIDDYRIRKYAASSESTATVGTPETAGTASWAPNPSIASNVVTTANVIVPVLNSATRVSEAQIDLGWSWTDTTSDETGFNIQRCEGAATNCTTFIVSPNTTSYTDKGLKGDQNYCYRISAVKVIPGGCDSGIVGGGWDSGYSVAQLCATTTSNAPTAVSAAAANTTTVNLGWTDNTKSEEGFKFWRCLYTGSNCGVDGDYSELSATTGANRSSGVDLTACSASTYYYKVQAYSNGPAGAGAPVFWNVGGTGTWSRRSQLTFANFIADYQTKVVVTYDSDMRTDFADLRFYDEVEEQELPYWIEKKTNGVSATVWFKTRTSSASISMYYGNPGAVSYSNGSNVFGAANIVTNVQANGSQYTGTTLTGPFVNADGFTIEAGLTLFALSNYPAIKFDATGTYLGTVIYLYPTTSFYRWDMDAGGGGSNYLDNSGTITYTLNDPQRWTIKVKNASYWFSFNGTQKSTNTNLPYTTGNIVYSSGSGSSGYFNFLLVRKYAATEPTVTVQPEEIVTATVWGSPKSTPPVSVLTPTVTTPTLNMTDTKASESEAYIVWTDSNTDESYYIVERGNAACDSGSFVAIGNTGAPNVFTYTDPNLPLNVTYCYRVKPYKAATCLWPDKYSATKVLTTAPPIPTGLTATNIDTTTIRLEWNDVSQTETSFEIFRCEGQGADCDADNEFALVGTRGGENPIPGVKLIYNDTSVCPTHTYTYRVRAVKSTAAAWTSGFSTVAEATPIATVAPSALSEAEIYDSAVDQRKIKLYWTDTNADETGFKIERCNYTVSGNCNGVNYTQVGMHYYNLNETFTTQIDPAVWTLLGVLQSSSATLAPPLNISNISGSASITWSATNKAAVLRTTSVNVAETNVYNYSKLALADPELLGNGNYDISLDFNIPNALPAYAQYYNFAKLRVSYPMAPGKSVTDYVYIERSKDNYLARSTINGVTSAYTTVPTTHTSGKLRITKVGTTITVYNWNNNAWNSLVSYVDSSNVLTGVMPTDVFVVQHVQRNEAQDITVEIDNVKIDATKLKFTDFNGGDPILPSNTYYYRVRAYKDNTACTEWTNLPTTNEVWEPTNPATPTTLTARAAGSKKMELQWTDNAADENGYIVEKKAANGKYVEIATLAANKKKYVDNLNLDPNTSYTYRVRAFRSDTPPSYSPYSNEATGKTFIYANPHSDDTTCKLAD